MGLNWAAQPWISLLITLLKRDNSGEGFKLQMDLQEGSLQGRWGLELHYRPQLSPRALVRCHLWSGTTPQLRACHTEQPHPELSCTLGRSRGTHSTKEGITSHTSHCWKGKIDHLLLWQQELLQTGKVMESGVLRAEGNKGRISSEKEGLMFAL